jgi:hypothetical protein
MFTLQTSASSSQFFFRFEANVSEYGSYLLHICMFWYIRKHHLFTSFASYLLQNIGTNLHINIRFDATQIHVEANIRFKANNRFLFLHTSKYLLQNIRFEANIHKTFSKFHIQ